MAGERPGLWALGESPRRAEHRARRPGPSRDPAHRAVVIGYGPTGRTLVRLLRDNDIDPTVIELNIDAVRALRERGRRRGLRRRDAARDARGRRRRRQRAA